MRKIFLIAALFSALSGSAAPWVSRHDMSAATYQTEFDTWTAAPYNYRLISVAGYEQGGQARYAAVWEARPGSAWLTHPGLTPAQFDSLNTTYSGQGYRAVFLSGFGVGAQGYCNAIWEYSPRADVVPAVGLTYSGYLAANVARSAQGYKLVSLWTYTVGATEYFAAIWRKGVLETYEARTDLNGSQFQQTFDDLAGQGFQLAVVSTSIIGGQERSTAVWKKPGEGVAWYAQSSLSEANYNAETWNWYYQGYRPVFVSVFLVNGAPRFNAVWFNNGGLSPSSLQTINNAIAGYMKNNSVPGVSLAISSQGRLVYAKGFGYADQAAGEWVHPLNRFRIASVSKPITATAVLKLTDKCNLNLGQTVFGPSGILGNSYGTPPYSSREKAITIRHLLSHTTGWTADGIWQVSSSNPADAIDWQIDNAEPASPPGSAYEYINVDFCTAGRVVERVSGKSYEHFVQDELFAPSCISEMEIGGNSLAERKPNEVVYYGSNPYALDLHRMDANGGWIAKPLDLLLFLRRIDGNSAQAEILENASFTAQHTGSVPQPGYGLGMVLTPSGGPIGNNEWGHNGAMDGTIAFLVYRTDGLAFAFACNTRPASDSYGGTLRSVVDGVINTLNAANAWPAYDLFPCSIAPGPVPDGFASPRDFYVDNSAGCLFATGQKSCSFLGGPFKTVNQAVNYSCAGDNLFVHAGSYDEPVTFSRRVTVQSYGGIVLIGK